MTLSIPALFTRPFTAPNSFAVRSAARLNAAKSRTSVSIAIAVPPAARMPPTTSSFR